MHILGLANGTFGGNSEILLKAALSAASEHDATITSSWIHVPSVVIPPNPPSLPGALDISHGKNASMRGPASASADGPDDRAAVLDAILDADALIFATPVYSRQPAGTLKAVIDRILGPYTDCSFAIRAKERKAVGDPLYQNVNIDERLLKPRVAAFICAAGSMETNQATMALPTLHTLIFSLHVKVVDQVVCYGVPIPGMVSFKEGGKAVLRAQELGRNVASQVGKAFDDAVYLGPHPRGACTYCHLKKIELKEENSIECVTCGAQGKLAAAPDGVMEPLWNKDCDVSSINMAGKRRHLDVVENGSKHAPLALMNPEFKKKKDAWTSLVIPQVTLPSASRVGLNET
ncbi:hypothetical protein MBLNU13_g05324t1, partial [Cladosporium sp. NU13]